MSNSMDDATIDQIHYYMHKHPLRRKGVQFMVNRLCLFGKITDTDVHRGLGNLCGYPKCCIDNYIDLMKRDKSPAKYMEQRYGVVRHCGYVKCLKCRIMERK